MAKDPRFNFYVDNWTGGTKRMNFEQKGAYLELLLLNFQCLSDGISGFTQTEAMTALASAGASAGALWTATKNKFQKDGELFYSERLTKEFFKSKKHSDHQTERAKNRWEKEPKKDAAAYACNGTGIGNGISFEIGLEECKAELLKNSEWVANACRQLFVMPEKIPLMIDEFIRDLKSGLVTKKTPSDFGSHFVNSTRIKQNTKTKNNGFKSTRNIGSSAPIDKVYNPDDFLLDKNKRPTGT